MYLFAIVTSSDPALDLNSFVGLGVNVATFILGIVGALTLLMFVYGGFTWILSGGSSDKVKKGKDIIIGSVIGLLIVFSSYMIIQYVVNDVFNSTTKFTGSPPPSTTQQKVPGDDCRSNNGRCSDVCSRQESRIGKSDCPGEETCCVAPAN